MDRAVDVLEMARAHAGKYHPDKVSRLVLQPTRKYDCAGPIDPVLDRDRGHQLITAMVTRVLEVVAIRYVDHRRGPGGRGHHQISILIRDCQIEGMRQTIAVFDQQLLKLSAIEGTPKSRARFEIGVIHSALDLLEEDIDGLDGARQLPRHEGSDIASFGDGCIDGIIAQLPDRPADRTGGHAEQHDGGPPKTPQRQNLDAGARGRSRRRHCTTRLVKQYGAHPTRHLIWTNSGTDISRGGTIPDWCPITVKLRG